MKKLLTLCLLLLCFSASAQYAVDRAPNAKPIPVDQAFKFSAAARDYQTILVKWEIAPGYYLYRARFHFRALKPDDSRLGQPLLPTGIDKTSPDVGTYQIYKHSVTIPIPVISSQGKNILLQASYQGCSNAGFCYPPTSKVIPINLAKHYGRFKPGLEIDVAPIKSEATPTHKPTEIGKLLHGKSLLTLILGFLGFGILISLTPCCLPMIPIVSGIILGQKKIAHLHSFLLSLAYVLGMAITYAIAGILFGFLGGSVQAGLQQPWIIIAFSLIFLAMAFSLFGFYNIQLPKSIRHRFAEASEHQKRGTYIGAALMGMFSTLILSPCVTAPLVGVLSYISQTGDATIGGTALFSMGIGMGVPLLIIGATGAKFLPKPGPWMNAVKRFMGILMLGVAIWMLTRILPPEINMLLWAALAIGTSIYMGALSTATNKWIMVRKIVGIIVFIYGILLVIGAFSGNTNPLNPLYFLKQGTQQSKNLIRFRPVKSIADVDRQLKIAKQRGKPVILDFYADWCISCKEMDHSTFSNAAVKNRLKRFILLRANVTKNDATDKALERHFNVVAPPTILFFNKDGVEVKRARIIGEMGPGDFLRHMDSIKKRLN